MNAKELYVLVGDLDTTINTRYKLETGPDKVKVMALNTNGFKTEIKMTVQILEEVENYIYLEEAFHEIKESNHKMLSENVQTTKAFH